MQEEQTKPVSSEKSGFQHKSYYQSLKILLIKSEGSLPAAPAGDVVPPFKLVTSDASVLLGLLGDQSENLPSSPSQRASDYLPPQWESIQKVNGTLQTIGGLTKTQELKLPNNFANNSHRTLDSLKLARNSLVSVISTRQSNSSPRLAFHVSLCADKQTNDKLTNLEERGNQGVTGAPPERDVSLHSMLGFWRELPSTAWR